ncbi:hypothetical protein SORBI_3005G156300 [Sorghum bicolor]|uniref:Uncharacterized protein n=1 Tax=Sorghum bicolor TaxID=4558 RepID=A0A1B6PSR1_SORBI|nr:hypothetical protein SORBI_3005G156300 [Sorghum bicolor]OQU83662.1 hypothetical protein SORBI_3005G156300 [Sorghum bicolor]
MVAICAAEGRGCGWCWPRPEDQGGGRVHRDHQLDDKSSSLHMHGGIKGKLAAAKMVTESTSGRRTWWPTPTALLSKVMEIMRGAFGTVSMGDGHVVAENKVRCGRARSSSRRCARWGRCGTRTCCYSRATTGRHSCSYADHGLRGTWQPGPGCAAAQHR